MENNTKHKKTIKGNHIERISEESIPWYSKRLLEEHKVRYLFAKKFVKNRVVVDVACGNGYGTSVLAKANAKIVYGIDYDKKVIDLAAKNYQRKNIKFINANAEKLPLNSRSVDVIVSFETIEHLKNYKKYLKEVKRVLKPDGVLIISTPNKETSYEDNPFHVREFSLAELDLLLSGFSKREIYGQRRVFRRIVYVYKKFYLSIPDTLILSPIKFLLRFRPWENQKIYKLENFSDTRYVYFIAICKNLSVVRSNDINSKFSDSNMCVVCGRYPEKWIFKKIISDHLAKSWKISDVLRRKFDLRESQFCPSCGNSARTRIFAQAIMNTYPIDGVTNLNEWVDKSKDFNLSIAEINSCGKLHNTLSKAQNLSYSEYPPGKLLPRIYLLLNRIRSEDITRLSYPNASFDLVLHSEVLEHVPDFNKAMDECRRILKPNGICLFTIPLIPNRKTKQCAIFDEKTGEILHLKKPSFHGLDKRKDNLVWWEFGYDFLSKYKAKIIMYRPDYATYVFSVRK